MLTVVDVHAEGEPGRVITSGVPPIPGATMLDKMQWMQTNADHLRLRMLREPRGYPGLCCNIVVPPTDPTADAGFIIMEQSEYAPMSGSNTICVATALLETGAIEMIEPVTELRLEAPAGIVDVRATCEDGKVTSVAIRNVPSFAIHLDAEIEVPELGTVLVDIAWGGMFFVIADADALGIDIDGSNGAAVVRASEMIRQATFEQLPVMHPLLPGLTGPTISQLSAKPTLAEAHRRNAVTVSGGTFDWDNPSTWVGALDRCPCGTGTSAKMAVLHARGLLDVGDTFIHEGPLGTTFEGQILETTKVGDYEAIVPEIAGQGWIYGFSNDVLDPTDPFPNGFTIGDIWG